MKRLIKKSFAVLSVAALVLAGCGKEDTQYGNEIGTVDGKINFDGTEPEIVLSNIKSYVGEEIDFLSGIEVGNIDENKDMETWVDSSLVDIFTPGDYKATYTIKYEGKEYTKDIVVTIITKENSGENNGTPKDNSQETTANGNENVPNGMVVKTTPTHQTEMIAKATPIHQMEMAAKILQVSQIVVISQIISHSQLPKTQISQLPKTQIRLLPKTQIRLLPKDR